jgi:methionine-rich copper-binding protein CopC
MTMAFHSRLTSPWRLFAVAVVAVIVGSGLWAPPSARAAVGVPVTYVSANQFGSGVASPSADKPQSKLWYLDGSWWALMVPGNGTAVTIHELMPDHSWRNTGTVVDSRINSTGDALWSTQSSKLWVASRVSGAATVVSRYTYNTTNRAWSADAGFPVAISGGGTESAAIDQEQGGLQRYWITYTRSSIVWVSHSTDSTGNSWVAPFRPSVPDTSIASDDLSSVIAFGSSIGVMYSDQNSGAFRFAIHNNADPDATWRVEEISQGLNFADDHINLKQLTGDAQGRVFAAVKTSAGDVAGASPDAMLVGVLTRTGAANAVGSWAVAQAGSVADDHSRPQIMIDQTNQELYFFATAPVDGGDIYYKKTPLSNVQFGPGRGAPFVDAPFVVNNATTAKDPATAASGLVVVAASTGQRRYVHAEMELAGRTADPAPTVTARAPAPNATGVAAASNVSATFSEAVQGVSDATFTLSGPGTTGVPAVVTQNGTTNQWVLNPNADLAPNTQYTVRLTGGASAIRDSANQPLANDSWTFTTAAAGTGDTTAPTVTNRAPAVNGTAASLTANLNATFSEAVQGVTNGTFTLRRTSPANSPTLAATVTRDGTTNRWFLNPAANLAADTNYTVTLTGGPTAIRDTADNPLTTVSWSFLTGPRPTVSARTPAVNATAVARTGNVSVTFNEPVQGVTLGTVTGTPSTFTLRATTGGAFVTSTVSRTGTTNQYVLNPNGTLAQNTTYTVTVTGGATAIRDLAGNPLASLTWRFTTGAT